MDKQGLLQRVIDTLSQRLKETEQGIEKARQAAIEAPGAMQSGSDTTKYQMGQLSEALERNTIETKRAISVLKNLLNHPLIITKGSVYAIIEAEELVNCSKEKFFLLPAGGGDTYTIEGEEITILNTGAPLARAFAGAVANDIVEFKIQRTTKRYRIISIT